MTVLAPPLPQRTPQPVAEFPTLESREAAPADTTQIMPMEGWFRELTATDRSPLMTREEVVAKWGTDYGSLVGQVILPDRSDPMADPSDPALIRDQSMRTLMIFDARESEYSPPHFVVASLTGLTQAAETKGSEYAWRKSNPDIHHIYEGENLRVGTGKGRWLPTALRSEEKRVLRGSGHQHRRVISKEQTLFYIGDDRELHVRSEGYNADLFVGTPNSTEQRYWQDMKTDEVEKGQRLRAARASRAATLALERTTSLGSPIVRTEYLPRHAGVSHTRTVPARGGRASIAGAMRLHRRPSPYR